MAHEHVFNALCEGKEVWEDKQLSVTLVPTYESEALKKLNIIYMLFFN